MKDMKMAIEIMHASNMLKRIFDNEIHKIDGNDNISTSNIKMISFLVNSSEEVFQKDIEERFSLKASTVSGSLKLLEEKGCIRREKSSVDTRKKRVVVTEKGIKLNDEVERSMEKLKNELNHILDDEESIAFSKMITKIKRELSNY